MRLYSRSLSAFLLMIFTHCQLHEANRQSFLSDIVKVNNIASYHTDALESILACVDAPGPRQVTFHNLADVAGARSITKAVHNSNLALLLNPPRELRNLRGFVHVVTLKARKSIDPKTLAYLISKQQTTASLGIFIIMYIYDPYLTSNTILEVSNEFFIQMGAIRLIHLHVLRDSKVYIRQTYNPFSNEFNFQRLLLSEFCSKKIGMKYGILPLPLDMKGCRAALYSTEENAWIDKEGKIRFDGPQIEILRELRKLGTLWIGSEKANPKRFGVRRHEDVSLHPVAINSCGNAEWIKSREFSVVIAQCDAYLVVRRADRIPFGLVLFLPFETACWYALAATIFLLVLAWMTVRTVRFQISGVVSAAIDIQEIVLTGGLSRSLQCAPQRIIVLCSILLSIVGGNAYTGLLLGFLTVPQYYRDLNTLEEATEATERLYVVSIYKDLLEERTNLNKTVKHITVINTTEARDDAIRDIIQTGKAATCLGEHLYFLISRFWKYKERGRVMLHKVQERLSTSNFLAYPVSKNHWFANIFNTFLLRLLQGGLYDHWSDVQRYNRLLDEKNLQIEGEETLQKLTMSQLSGPFILFVAGLVLATTAFLIEQLFERKIRKKQNR